ncbi:glutamine synthetase catalytic region [Emticicia oligotrophica DSM 17448]|uniref:Glutamine synthetase catalytic region n=1 Tax=Emticicia oligotrophica (strain DSM 17448 / CIP 109782 / MTCC 6937 / GPTSA100-15) TaxID=929562 RepID=A0ABN4ATX5_EMTOG|nr:glutamine synthetase III [Emticicia oligotrophica]AFK05237.1 glutamine synthetase catalytic region [Emticicia oligotrophica DSM 17448]
MARLRFKAVEEAQSRTATKVEIPTGKVTEFYGSNIFNDEVMRAMLSPEAYMKVTAAIKNGDKIDREIADEVAAAMKSWAVSKGATHYTHWFQPLTGGSAEKHDAFFDINLDGKAVEKFKGSALTQQEPDASSFPNGGIRATFEARGYTAWDPTSPAFIMYNEAGTGTLCIPSIFVSYTGELLDSKSPLLKSLHALDKAATEVAVIFDRHVEKVSATLGAEQEYFLVDKSLFNARPDLMMAGRTVFGHAPAKGQQLDDHYFGSIPPRVNAFMVDFEFEALKLGIPVRTRHNEVAPAQFEAAPTFEEVNLACDHNILLMDLMRKIARKHNFEVLFHEKPFAGINGSGKHNNWSLGTDTGVNLLGPSTKPKESLRFVTFLVNVVKAVHDNADLLRASIASAGNEHRLGANEAPPAIISIFLGTQMTKVLNDIENKEIVSIEKGENAYIKLGLNRIPSILLDNTDRNRTSPFAFTGNKFEYRAVGGSANSAQPMMILNTIVANQLEKFRADYDAEMNEHEGKKEEVIVKILKGYIKESKRILFEGNGYGDEWKEEAARRGLSNIASTPEALKAYLRKEFIEIFERLGVLTEREFHARYEIELENYIKKIQIESRVIGDLAMNHVVSTAVKYQTRLVQTAKSLKDMGLDTEAEPVIQIIKEISERVTEISKKVNDMTEARKKANNLDDIEEQARLYGTEIKSFFDEIRYHVDKLEILIDDEDWPLVKYRELLYIR